MHWLLKITFALVYTIVYFFLALLSTGGGHGNYYLLLTPIIPWLLLFAAIYFIGKLETQLNRILFVMLMIAHYVLLFVFLLSYPFEKDRGWKFGAAIVPVIWYLSGQIAVWVLFVNETMLKAKE